MHTQPKNDSDAGLGGILNALEKLAKLADDLQNAQGELNREGEIDLGKNAKASYRFRLRTLADLKRASPKPDFKPFEKLATSKTTKTAPTDVPKRIIAEPDIDLFIEGDSVAIYAQLPGVSDSSISIDARPDRLMLHAESASFLYEKDLSLPALVQPESLIKSYNNGILEVRLTIQPNA